MLVLHNQKLIFIHIYKTGGTSIKNVLYPYSDKEISRQVSKTIGGHTTAKNAKEFIDKNYPGMFDSYTKFCVIRNPYQWQVSLYNHIRGNVSHSDNKIISKLDYKDYLKWLTDVRNPNSDIQSKTRFLSLSEFIRDENGNILIDDFVRYENGLSLNFKNFITKHKMETKTLPKLNVGKIGGGSSYKKYYDEESKELLYNLFREDIDFFNYTL